MAATCGRAPVRRWVSEGQDGPSERAAQLPGLVFFCFFFADQAPGRVVGTRDGTALRARFGVLGPEEVIKVVVRPLEGACFLETAVSTLLHGPAPTSTAVVRGLSVADGVPCPT